MAEKTSYTKALLHFNDDFTDEVGNVWTNDGCSIDKTVSKFGGGSLRIKSLKLKNASGDLSPHADDDFTMDFWVKCDGEKSNVTITFHNENNVTIDERGIQWAFWVRFGDSPFFMYQTPYGLPGVAAKSPVADSKFHHYALTKQNGVLYFFLDGNLQDTRPGSDFVFTSNSSSVLTIDGSACNFDEFRIEKGICRWTEHFTPPDKEYKIDGGTDPTDPVDPTDPADTALLRVTMIDSSEREYQLTIKEIDGFINWYNSTGTKEPSYKLTKHIGTSISKEYLAFQKIISFEVK